MTGILGASESPSSIAAPSLIGADCLSFARL